MSTGNDNGILLSASEKEAFVSLVLDAGRQHYRDLPWRYIDDPYGVLVSEVMLQQTQVKRVLNYWPMWLNRFPTVDALAAASTAAVLESWQGLGYNRRALALKRCAEACSARYAGKLPSSYAELLALDGIGPATAGGIMAFAYRQPAVYLETNVRTVLIHHFPGVSSGASGMRPSTVEGGASGKLGIGVESEMRGGPAFGAGADSTFAFSASPKVSDKALAKLLQDILPCAMERTDAATWYYALLDYGAYLKATVGNLNRCSKAYTRQSTFKGSRRQKRSFLVRCVLDEPGCTAEELFGMLNQEEGRCKRKAVVWDEFLAIMAELQREGFFAEEAGRFRA